MKKILAALLLSISTAFAQPYGPGPVPTPTVYLDVYMMTGQTVTASTPTQVQFDTVNINTGSYWDTGTHVWTPLVSGTYLVCSHVNMLGTISSNNLSQNLQIRKNGSIFRRYELIAPALGAGGSGGGLGDCVLIPMNGTTDNVDVAVVFNVSAGSPSVQGNSSPFSYLSITRVGP